MQITKAIKRPDGSYHWEVFADESKTIPNPAYDPRETLPNPAFVISSDRLNWPPWTASTAYPTEAAYVAMQQAEVINHANALLKSVGPDVALTVAPIK